MNSKSILVGVVIGILVGGVLGYASVPAPDYTLYENQIAQFESQVLSLSGEIGDLEEQLEEVPSQENYIELQQQVSILEASVNSADFNINLLTEEVSSLELQVVSLEASVSSKEYNINLLTEEIVSLESEISDFEAPVEFEFVTVSFSRPEDTSSLLQYWIGEANVTIRLMVMLITQDELASSLIDAHERGVDIDVIIDNDWYYSSGSDYQDILDAGIDIRGDERGGLMHHKVMIIDGYIIVTGSYNWSASAEDSNDENTIIIKSIAIASSYRSEFDRIWGQTTPPQIVTEPTEYTLTLILNGEGAVTVSEGTYDLDYVSPTTVELSFTVGDWIPENPIEIETGVLDEVISVKLDGVDITNVEKGEQTSGYEYLSYFGDYGTWAIYMNNDHEVEITFEDPPEPISERYVGSKNSDVYHRLSCHYVNNILESNKVYFSSKAEAEAAGYRACKVCKP